MTSNIREPIRHGAGHPRTLGTEILGEKHESQAANIDQESSAPGDGNFVGKAQYGKVYVSAIMIHGNGAGNTWTRRLFDGAQTFTARVVDVVVVTGETLNGTNNIKLAHLDSADTSNDLMPNVAPTVQGTRIRATSLSHTYCVIRPNEKLDVILTSSGLTGERMVGVLIFWMPCRG